MKKSIFLLTLLLPAITFCGLDTSDWKLSNPETKFTVRKIENGTLTLVDEDSGKLNNSLIKTFSGNQQIKEFLNKELVFSAEIKQVSASREGVVGISLGYKTRDNQRRQINARIMSKDAVDFKKYQLALYIPENTQSISLGVDCASGYYNKAAAEFRNLELTSRQLNSEMSNASWSTGSGNFINYGREPISWQFRELQGAVTEIKPKELKIQCGEIQIRWGDEESLSLRGDGSNAKLVIITEDKTPFDIDWLSFGKRNATVSVKPEAVTKGGSIGVSIPLESFAPFHDLLKFEGLSITCGQPVAIKSISLVGLDEIGDVVNLLPDASFEQAVAPRSNYVMVGDYLPGKNGSGYRLDSSKAFHGQKSLLLEPGGFYTWYGFDKAGHGSAFSFYAIGGGELEMELQPIITEHHGGSSAEIFSKKIAVSADWQRYFISGKRPVKRAAEVEFNLFRAMVRNTGNTPVNIDAVQLEQNTDTPREFNPERNSKFRFKTPPIMSMTRYPDMKAAAQKKSGSVKFKITGPAGQDIPVQGGIPFAKGELFSAEKIILEDQSGRRIPAQFKALARRPFDSSIISLLVAFQYDQPGEFTLKYGPDTPVSPAANLAIRQGDSITIDTGKLKLTLDKNHKDFKCMVVTPDGVIHCGKAEIMELQDNGPMTCTVFLRGKSLLEWELRITAFAGKPYLQLDYSYERNFTGNDQLNLTVQSIFLQLPGSKSYRFGQFKGNTPASFVQRHTNEGQAEWNVYKTENGTGEVIANTILDGEGQADKADIKIMEFSEMAPRGISFSSEGTRIYLWPESGVDNLDVPAGFSNSTRVFYAPNGGLPPSTLPLLQVDPQHVIASGVFGNYLTESEMKDKFPKTSRLIEDVFAGNRKFEQFTHMKGFAAWGDHGSRNYYRNHETAGVRNLWIQYLQTYLPEDFTIAAAHSRHMRDVDLCHFQRGSSGVQTHNTWVNFSYNFHTGHFWISGLVYYYYLTGDSRALEKAISAASILVQKSTIKYQGGRERHRMLLHLTELYELTGSPQVREAFERQYAHGGVSDSASYYGAISHECLYRLYEVTGDSKYLERLFTEAEKFQKQNVTPPAMPEDRTKSPTTGGSADQGRGAMVMYTGALLSKLKNDASYLNYLIKGNHNPLLTYLMAAASHDNSAVWATPYLAEMARLNIQEEPATPDNYYFIHRLTGKMLILNNYQDFNFLVNPDAQGRAVIDLYRQRKFRYWQQKTDQDKIVARITADNGTVLKQETVYGNVTFEHSRLAVNVPDGKPVKVKVSFLNDCWGSVSSPNPMRLATDRWFGVRNSVSVPYSVWLKAPMSGELTVNWRWADRNNDQAGSPLALLLETPDGKTVAQDCRIIPLKNGGAKYQSRLSIPPEFRGQILRLWLPDLKWVEWQLEGLDYPWLGNCPADLK